MKNKVLIIDSSFAIQPLFDFLTINFEVFTIGHNQDAFYSKKNKSRHFFVNYSDVAKVKQLLQDKKINFYVPGCNDVSLETFSKIKKSFHNNLIRKIEFWEFCKNHKIKHPEVYSINNCKFPVIVKPDMSYSGQGIKIIKNIQKLKEAISYASNFSSNKKYIIQQFIYGQLYSCFVYKNKINQLNKLIVIEYCNNHKFSVDESFVVNLSDDLNKKLNVFIEKLYKSFGDMVSSFSIQFIIQNESIYVLEFFLRSPGDLYFRLLELTTSVNFAPYYLSNYLNLCIDKKGLEKKRKRRKIKRITYKIHPGEAVPEIKIPNNAIEFHKVLDVGCINNSEIPLRFAVIFLEVSELKKDYSDVNFVAKN